MLVEFLHGNLNNNYIKSSENRTDLEQLCEKKTEDTKCSSFTEFCQ